ncbi:MAG: hypothetical protein PHS92_00345 [Candidatus Gracilibacteria bacterium]|nr:hypothetical protein [Candidatus Gracilibacteria bacterium]
MAKIVPPCNAFNFQEGEQCPGLCPDGECIREKNKSLKEEKKGQVDVILNNKPLSYLTKTPQEIVFSILGEQSPEVEAIVEKIFKTKYKEHITDFVEMNYFPSLGGLTYGYAEMNNGKFLVFYERKIEGERKIGLIEAKSILKLKLGNDGKPEGIQI